MLLNCAMLLKAAKNPSLNTCKLQRLYFRHNALLSCETENPFCRLHMPVPGEYTSSKLLSHPLDSELLLE